MSTNSNNLVPMPTKVWSDTPTPRKREALWIAEGKVCHWCGCSTRLCNEPDADQATIEHIIPRVKGGTDDPENLCSACHMCNQRRAYEDQCGLQDGALLGKYPLTPGQKRQFGIRPKQKVSSKHIALTGDEKRAILGGKQSAETVLREQRDQALKEIAALKRDLKISEGKEKSLAGEVTLFQKIVEDQEKELKEFKSITVWKILRKRISDWIKP